MFRVGEKRIRCVQMRINDGNMVMQDRRGFHNNKSKIVPEAIRSLIRTHINSYPTQISHYKRAIGDPLQPFLHHTLNIATMLRTFKTENMYLPGISTCDWIYRDEFRKTGLKFQSVRSDTCKRCDELYIRLMDCNNQDETNEVIRETENHHVTAESAYKNMANDFQRARNEENFVCLAVDLQQILFSPTLRHSDVFYKRQFGSYNLCIYDARTDDGTMLFWTEIDGGRGADEIISCIQKYVLQNFNLLQNNEERTLVVWSDRCKGQNNNFPMLVEYLTLICKR